jgi:ribosomal protein L40E
VDHELNMTKCGVCGATNPSSAIACVKCGAPLYLQPQSTNTQTTPRMDGVPSTQPADNASQTPVATVDYKRGLPVMGIVSTIVFIIIVVVGSLSSGAVSLPIVVFAVILVAITVINIVGRNRTGVGTLRYEFYPNNVTINYGRGSTTVPYSDFDDVELRGTRIIVGFKPGSRMRRIIVPGNPTVSGGSTTLYEWLSSKITSEQGSQTDSAVGPEQPGDVNSDAAPGP